MIKNTQNRKIMGFIEEKAQILSILRRGDKAIIGKRAKVGKVAVWKAHNAKSIREMSPAEKKAWIATVEYVNEKLIIELKDKQKTSKVAKELNVLTKNKNR